MMHYPYRLVIYIVLCALSLVQMFVYSYFKVRGKGKAYTISKCTGSTIFVLTAVEALLVGLLDKSSGVTVDSYTAIITFALQAWLAVDYFTADECLVFRFTAVFPIIAVIFDLLAAKNILADEMMVRSASRLRSAKKK